MQADGRIFKNVLVFSAHPDDEVIGCGGTLKAMADKGANITVVIATTGNTGISTRHIDMSDIAEIRQAESKATCEILGIGEIIFLPYGTQELINDKQTFHTFIREIRRHKPDLVLTHASQDKHRDHRAVHAITREAVWKAWENIMPELGERHRVGELWHYEVLDPFAAPHIYVDISKTLEHKREAMSVHISQQDILANIDRFIDGLAKVRGFAIERDYAEAFVLDAIHPSILDLSHVMGETT